MGTDKMWLSFGLSVFGFTVGLLCGLSVSQIVSNVLGLLFVFFGSTIFVLAAKKPPEEKKQLGQLMAFFCLSLVVGAFLGMASRNLEFTRDDEGLRESLTSRDIFEMDSIGVGPDVIQELIRIYRLKGRLKPLSPAEIIAMRKRNVSQETLLGMVLGSDLDLDAYGILRRRELLDAQKKALLKLLDSNAAEGLRAGGFTALAARPLERHEKARDGGGFRLYGDADPADTSLNVNASGW
jgi:hypothetical protein